MYNFKIETSSAIIVDLTNNERKYQIINISGLTPPSARINTADVVGMDGATFNSSKLNTRNIVITIRINGNVEENRQELYQYFRTKEYCKIYYQNRNRDVYIEGYVETFEGEIFSKSETMQISIICTNPYFKDTEIIIDDLTKVINRFIFPFNINLTEPIVISELEISKVTNIQNISESETGFIAEALFLGAANRLEIKNISTGETFIINYEFLKNDRLFINTNKGSKLVILIRDGVERNIISAIERGTTFFQLRIGDNYFSYLLDNGERDNLISLQFKHYNIYRGV